MYRPHNLADHERAMASGGKAITLARADRVTIRQTGLRLRQGQDQFMVPYQSHPTVFTANNPAQTNSKLRRVLTILQKRKK